MRGQVGEGDGEGTVGMIYGSVCSGIEAASVAWEPLGWRASWFSEIVKFPSAVLAHRFPAVGGPDGGSMWRKSWIA